MEKKISKCYILEYNNYWEKLLYIVDYLVSECWRLWIFFLLVQLRMIIVYVYLVRIFNFYVYFVLLYIVGAY